MYVCVILKCLIKKLRINVTIDNFTQKMVLHGGI